MNDIPVWDNDSIYQGFEDPRYLKHVRQLSQAIGSVARILKKAPGPEAAILDKVQWVKTQVSAFDRASSFMNNLFSYAQMVYSVDTKNSEALRQINRIEEITVPLSGHSVNFRNLLGKLGVSVGEIIKTDPALAPRRLALEEDLLFRKHQLSEAEELLASDLGRSGGDAWSRLHDTLSANLSVPWDEKTGEKKTVVELRMLALDPDREIRRKAWEKEVQAWKSVEIPMAASLNGVKGFAHTLNSRRGWKSALELACRQSRMSSEALSSMLGAMEDSLPLFRNYLKAKASALGLRTLGFYDLFAPVGQDSTSWDFAGARRFIVSGFGTFSQSLAAFADRAFEKNWIHARPQEGKIGGAYCTSLPLAKEPRVMSNFDGTFSEVKTLAHELGHGYHFWLLKNDPAFMHEYPMTLAETASIFCETIIFEKAFRQASGPTALFVLEQQLQDVTQVIVDILSRFKFEKSVFEKRAVAELTAQEFCALMVQAQKETYGDTLDPAELHPYMWAVKVHYYSPHQGFYNFPYAFGQLFSYALYELLRTEGRPFIARYEKLLRETGIKSADQLAKGLGFDLRKKDFWERGLRVIEDQITQFQTLSKGSSS